MEDISRELEREIERAKPAPYKSKKQRRILIIDDFGELSSGGYLKTLVYLFFCIGLLGFLGTIGFYLLFSTVQKENSQLKERLTALEKKSHQLTNDKEILMARLVMAGKKPELAAPEKQAPPAKEKQPGIMPKPSTQKVKEEKVTAAASTDSLSDDLAVDTPPAPTPAPPEVEKAEKKVEPPAPKPVVSVEKFSVIQGKSKAELIVKFNIRNISKTSKEISGRIFSVLKPENSGESDWVVAPGGKMEDGVPGPYRRGQYFSISRFKPVKFTIKNQAAPDSFSVAAIYIFGDDKKLMFENTIPINGAD